MNVSNAYPTQTTDFQGTVKQDVHKKANRSISSSVLPMTMTEKAAVRQRSGSLGCLFKEIGTLSSKFNELKHSREQDGRSLMSKTASTPNIKPPTHKRIAILRVIEEFKEDTFVPSKKAIEETLFNQEYKKFKNKCTELKLNKDLPSEKIEEEVYGLALDFFGNFAQQLHTNPSKAEAIEFLDTFQSFQTRKSPVPMSLSDSSLPLLSKQNLTIWKAWTPVPIQCVLIVEDNQVNLKMIHLWLNKAGYVDLEKNNSKQKGYVYATNYPEAEKKISVYFQKKEEHEIDFAFLDIELGHEKKGYHLAQSIRNLEKESSQTNSPIPLIAFTANAADASNIETYQKHGLNGALTKPGKKEEFISCLTGECFKTGDD